MSRSDGRGPQGLAPLKGLKTLYLNNTKVTGRAEGVAPLTGLQKLPSWIRK